MENIFNSWIVQTPIAHRGLHDKTAPENSLPAFAKAVELGYAIELDVHLLADDTVVVFHDESLARMTGNDGYIKYLNKEDLKMLHLSGSKECIPTLTEVLELVSGKVPILIEIKNPNKVGKLEQAVIDILKNYKGEFAVMSFNPYSVGYFKKHAPNIWRGQLSGSFKGQKMPFFQKYVLRHMLLNKKVSEPDFIAYEYTALPNPTVKKYKKLPLIVCAVPNQTEYMKIVKYCDNVIFEGFEPKI